MASSDDLAVGKAVLERQLVPREALLDCLFETFADRRGESARAFARPLGVLLLQRGHISDRHLSEMLGDRFAAGRPVSRIGDLPLGELMVGLGYVARAQVQESLEVQKVTQRPGAPRPRLGEILVERGLVTTEQVARALAYQDKEIYRCTRCAVRVNLGGTRPGTEPTCQFCGGVLVPAEPGSIGVHDSMVVQSVPRSSRRALTDSSLDDASSVALPALDAHQLEIDRAVELYVRQKDLARRASVREARRVQAELASYALILPLLEVLRRTKAVTGPQLAALEKEDFEALVGARDWKDQEVPGYRALDRVAYGGWTTLYTARPVFGQGVVALKVLRPERAGDDAVARLKREASLLRRLDHPHVVKGLEYGHSEGVHFLVMEYFPAMSLGQAIAESRGFAPPRAVAIVRQLVDALEYLRRQGYIHRDIKPDNVLVNEGGTAKLCDLGFAAEIGSVPDGERAGTAGYVAPDSEAGVASDIYSLGITFYAMLAGREPFAGVSSEVMVSEFVEGGLPPPDLLKVKAPPAVLDVVRRMTHPDRAERPSSYVDLSSALSALPL